MALPRKVTKATKATEPAKSKSIAAVPATPTTIEKSEVKGSGTTGKSASSPSRAISHDMIAKRAYEIYASRGYAPGDQNADWAEAERQLKAGL